MALAFQSKIKTLRRIISAIYPRRQLTWNVIHGAIIFDTRYAATCRQLCNGRCNHFSAFQKNCIFSKRATFLNIELSNDFVLNAISIAFKCIFLFP